MRLDKKDFLVKDLGQNVIVSFCLIAGSPFIDRGTLGCDIGRYMPEVFRIRTVDCILRVALCLRLRHGLIIARQ